MKSSSLMVLGQEQAMEAAATVKERMAALLTELKPSLQRQHEPGSVAQWPQ